MLIRAIPRSILFWFYRTQIARDFQDYYVKYKYDPHPLAAGARSAQASPGADAGSVAHKSLLNLGIPGQARNDIGLLFCIFHCRDMTDFALHCLAEANGAGGASPTEASGVGGPKL